MRIAIFHNRYLQRGGEDTAVDGEAELLEKGGHRVERCLVENRDALARPLSALRTALRARRNPHSASLVATLLRAGPVDVAHVHNFFPVLSPSLHEALSSRGVPVVQTLHNYRLLCANGNLLREGRACEECLTRGPWHAVRYGCYRGSRLQTAVWAEVVAHHRARGTWLRCVDRFAALSEFARRKFIAAGLPGERIEVANQSLEDPGEPAPPGEGAIYVGRLSREKGVDLLIDAWREAIGTPLAIAGTGAEEGALRERARGVPRVRFLGALSHDAVLRELRAAAFAVVPSRCYENAPFAAVEALASARPVVAWRGGSLADVIEEGRSGLLFDALDPRSISATCRRLANDRQLVQRLGAGARERYLERHAPDVVLAQRERLYAAVIEERRRGGSRGAVPAPA
ncbi:MAG: glycosyltransferase [Deltaproteobacteria bacterium]|nr:MAG: glycosyltransferase [Deltaproteobacteria bacterium]